jgi:hypothetical protein
VKVLKNIISVLLVLSMTNVVAGKTIHELFHHHHEIKCTAKTTQHFHNSEFSDADLICSFNFSASLNQFFAASFKHQLFAVDREASFFYTSNNQNNFFNTLSLRGPPQLV